MSKSHESELSKKSLRYHVGSVGRVGLATAASIGAGIVAYENTKPNTTPTPSYISAGYDPRLNTTDFGVQGTNTLGRLPAPKVRIEGSVPPKHDNGHTPGNPHVPADQDPDTPDKPMHIVPRIVPIKEIADQDVRTLPGNPRVPASQDPGSPDQLGTHPALAGESPLNVPRQVVTPAPAPTPSGVRPAVVGYDPVRDPNFHGPIIPPVQVPGTSNLHGQNGAVDPR